MQGAIKGPPSSATWWALCSSHTISAPWKSTKKLTASKRLSLPSVAPEPLGWDDSSGASEGQPKRWAQGGKSLTCSPCPWECLALLSLLFNYLDSFSVRSWNSPHHFSEASLPIRLCTVSVVYTTTQTHSILKAHGLLFPRPLLCWRSEGLRPNRACTDPFQGPHGRRAPRGGMESRSNVL